MQLPTKAETCQRITNGFTTQLVILEQPCEKFRFRYKSEMQGTHGPLTGERSQKHRKTFPEVELKNFYGVGVIRCTLYQVNMERPSLHSHQLVVYRDDMEVCDPHNVEVSPQKGYIARFENMGVIHTAKKDITKELLKKKKTKLKLELQCKELTHKQEEILKAEAEKESKSMNLNQVCLCFEAFKKIEGGRLVRVCEPVFSRQISNRKSAQTGDLKICRLSAAVGTAAGDDDLILLVEKISKNNIKVRFYEIVDDKEVWEAYGKFTESDVHHQYAIVVRTPAYRSITIENHVNVFIELVRDDGNERSAPVSFRYKPLDIVLSRKRRRIVQTSSSIYNSEHPQSTKFVKQEQIEDLEQHMDYNSQLTGFIDQCNNDPNAANLFHREDIIDFEELGLFQIDGGTSKITKGKKFTQPTNDRFCTALRLIRAAFENAAKLNLQKVIAKVHNIIDDYTACNEKGMTFFHDIVRYGTESDAVIVFKIISKLNLTHFVTQTNKFRQTPLHAACIYDRAAFIRPLLNLKCNINAQDRNGNTALHIAVRENLKDCFKSLVSSGLNYELNADLANYDGQTPLFLAIRKNNTEFVNALLIDCKASVKLANTCDGNNALQLAVLEQNEELVKIILDKGKVNLMRTNRAGHTAIDLANKLQGAARKNILGLLHLYLPDSAGQLPLKGFIKEEELEDSCSSTGYESSHLSIDIKDEDIELNLKELLNNDKVASRLAAMLSTDEKWKTLAEHLKLKHLIFVWPDARALLRYIAGVDEVQAMNVMEGLDVVHKDAALYLRSLLE